ncbi:PREDICTED: PHD finger-like domain-containing protein 5A [Pygoscelis adeliae]|uniref:PHD finger-like domain-containing protein 5A n=1 Tax=Pygoscelis adeliae TaxID=9238 RepID=UPI0004F4E295|nr:PREDICTED: PHD finger-like domain-containing protein 5A [Pygoscelis adeliae]
MWNKHISFTNLAAQIHALPTFTLTKASSPFPQEKPCTCPTEREGFDACVTAASCSSAIGRLCEKCDGKCVICDSYVRPCTLVRICDECNYGSYQGRCVICGGPGVSDAYYCKECTIQEKDRDGCPKIVNLGSSKTDLFYERKKYGFKKR